MIRPRLPSTLALLFVACAPSAEPPPVSEPAASAVDYEALMSAARIPGLVVAVIDDGEIARRELLGVASAETGEPSYSSLTSTKRLTYSSRTCLAVSGLAGSGVSRSSGLAPMARR